MEGVFEEGFCAGVLGRFDGLQDMVGDLVDGHARVCNYEVIPRQVGIPASACFIPCRGATPQQFISLDLDLDLFLNLGLPDLDRLQIAEGLRELSDAPWLMITARASATDQFNSMAAGASALS